VQGCTVNTVIYTGESAYQTIEILDTSAFGRMLVLDGKIQSAEGDEFVYHESLVHPALVTHPHPESICIAGGGEGATAREVLRHGSVRTVQMVDLDEEVVEVCRTHLPNFHKGAFDDPRLKLHFDDAKRFFKSTPERFDIVILDLSDPTAGGPASSLYTLEFYQILKARLNPGGVLVTQMGPSSTLNYKEVFTAIHNTLEKVFPNVAPYTVSVESFGECWGFGIASSGLDPTSLTSVAIDSCLQNRGVSGLKFYDGITHQGLFSLPRFLRDALNDETRIGSEEHPLSMY